MSTLGSGWADHPVHIYCNFQTTRCFWIQRALPEIWLKSLCFKSIEKLLLNLRHNFGSVIAKEQDVVDTCQMQRKVLYYYRKVETVNLPFTFSLNQSEHHMQHNFLEMNSTADSNQLIQVPSSTGLGNEMRMKSRLLPFSLVFDVVFSFVIFHIIVNAAVR